MRRIFALFLLMAMLPGCQNKPDFDERYSKVEQQINESAAAMDAELSAREAESAGIDRK